MTKPTDAREYLIRKGAYWYRPDAAGYTSFAHEAGRYTRKEAYDRSHPNGPDGPRDEIDFMHISEVAALSATDGRKQGLEEAAQGTLEEWTHYIMRYQGHCRDCADDGPNCPNKGGMPCDGTGAEFSAKAIIYGLSHGYITSPQAIRKAGEATAPVSPSPDALLRKAGDALLKASTQFDFYATNHRAKNTREADQKAAVNTGWSMELAEIADEIDQHLKAGEA